MTEHESNIRAEKVAILVGMIIGQISELLNSITDDNIDNKNIYKSLCDIHTMAGMQIHEIYYRENKSESILAKHISFLDLDQHSYLCLVAANIITINDLINFTKNDLLKLRNLGKKSLKEIISALSSHNLKLREIVND
jgi:DNA-directed RNA polymerase subunit alpha